MRDIEQLKCEFITELVLRAIKSVNNKMLF